MALFGFGLVGFTALGQTGSVKNQRGDLATADYCDQPGRKGYDLTLLSPRFSVDARTRFTIDSSTNPLPSRMSIGYDKAAKVAHYELDNDLALKQAALKLGFLTEEEFDRAVDPRRWLVASAS